jgi:lactoylglutathione lyase
VEHFGCIAGSKYTNPSTGFSSYFIQFTSGARLELMTKPHLATAGAESSQCGYAHFALSLGSEEQVRTFTEILRGKGIVIKSAPRQTGDGYFESVVADPDGNLIELTV